MPLYGLIVNKGENVMAVLYMCVLILSKRKIGKCTVWSIRLKLVSVLLLVNCSISITIHESLNVQCQYVLIGFDLMS